MLQSYVSFLYCPLFYIGVIVIYQCKSTYNIRRYVCGGACYESEPILGMIDWLGNTSCSVIIIFLVNVILIVRHAIQRRRMKGTVITAHRRHQWVRVLRFFIIEGSMLNVELSLYF
jgi:hypothetical protein